MRKKSSASMMMMVAVAAAGGSVFVPALATPASAQSAATSGATSAAAPLKTSWGEPDLQGIWTDETTRRCSGPPNTRTRNFSPRRSAPNWTRMRSEVLGRERRAERGTERDVSGSYNNVFVSFKRTGARTSLIVDPPNGRMPPLTPEAQKLAARRAGFSSRLVAIDRDLQEQGGRPVPAENTIRRTRLDSRGSSAALQHRRA